MYFFCNVIISRLGKKAPKVVYHGSRVIQRSKSIFNGTLKWGVFFSVINFSKYCCFASLTKNWVKNDRKMKVNRKGKFEVNYTVKKLQIGISCSNVDSKMRVKSKRYFYVNYFFMKPFSQNFEVLTQHCDVTNAKLAWKRV